MPKSKKSKKVQSNYRNITAAAYHDEPLDFINWKGVQYFVYGHEICPKTKKPHLQYYLEFKTQKPFKTIKNRYPKLHFEARWDTQENCINYCKKDGKFVEHGTPKAQGQRGDLKELVDEIMAGELSLEEIIIDTPMLYHQYGRTLKEVENLYFQTIWRTEQTTCDWYIGPSGSGKSHRALKGYHPKTHYKYKKDNGWWDMYKNQDTVVINEFRGEIAFGELLELIGWEPYSVNRRNTAPRPFTSKHIIITSMMHPRDVYHNVSERDDFIQLMRRINLIKLTEVYQKPKKTNGGQGGEAPVLPLTTSDSF